MKRRNNGEAMGTSSDEDFLEGQARCVICRQNGDDYYYDGDDNLICACDECFNNDYMFDEEE